MLADSIPAAHVTLTETSAHPVAKSSSKRRLHDPAPTQKGARDGTGRGTFSRNRQPQCPLGVISAVLTVGRSLSVLPLKRTFSVAVGMSRRGQTADPCAQWQRQAGLYLAKRQLLF